MGTHMREGRYGRQDMNSLMNMMNWRRWITMEKKLHDHHMAVTGSKSCDKIWPKMVVPTKEDCEKNSTYFADYIPKDIERAPVFNRMMHFDYGYDEKLPRDDHRYVSQFDIGAEDSLRTVPVRTSTIYGHYLERSPILPLLPKLEKDNRFKYRENIRKGFFRDRGTNLKFDTEKGTNINIF